MESTSLANSTRLASWRPPAWATRSRLEDSGIWHLCDHTAPLSALGNDGTEVSVRLEVSQLDSVDAGLGAVQVLREGSPVVLLDGMRLTLAQADCLGRALVVLAERIRSAG